MVICQHFSWLSSRKVWVKSQLKLLALALEHPYREWNRASLYLAWRIQEQRWWQPSYYKRLPPENHCLCTTRGKKATSIHKLIENKSQTLTFVQQLHRIFITTAMSGDLWHPPVFSANEPISSKPFSYQLLGHKASIADFGVDEREEEINCIWVKKEGGWGPATGPLLRSALCCALHEWPRREAVQLSWDRIWRSRFL